uniref:Uncharacterized protein n=1 Tax=Pithovirus LCDPAC02 TaxID=2506601 RepID=A0A481YPJ6_9VIRU|nr:MAG: hypothetical protein LCDPAC02_02280 [Pithovirus LCDPAC02]
MEDSIYLHNIINLVNIVDIIKSFFTQFREYFDIFNVEKEYDMYKNLDFEYIEITQCKKSVKFYLVSKYYKICIIFDKYLEFEFNIPMNKYKHIETIWRKIYSIVFYTCYNKLQFITCVEDGNYKTHDKETLSKNLFKYFEYFLNLKNKYLNIFLNLNKKIPLIENHHFSKLKFIIESKKLKYKYGYYSSLPNTKKQVKIKYIEKLLYIFNNLNIINMDYLLSQCDM